MVVNIDLFIDILEKNFKSWKAPVADFAPDRGRTVFEVLVSTVLSSRTKDEVTIKAVSRLFAVARTPLEILELGEDELAGLIYPVGFYRIKAGNLRKISRIIVREHGGRVPDTMDELLRLPGVGRKTANLVLAQGFGKNAICVDTHVHRISNRIGYVSTKTPEQTERALIKKLPIKHWAGINKLFVGFGQTICRPISPRCGSCPVSSMCPAFI
ncbi:MAG: endonuclease III [Desulfobulbaceae bacterium]|nr:endonuclease III [Desulfobulbaceae bacterium]MCK5437088.1 endonuclease III [Desulfobulbaceae bacterium]